MFRYLLVLSFCFLVDFSAPFASLQANAAPFYLSVSKSAKSNFIGEWQVVTQVTWSDCSYVKEGEMAKSKLSVNEINGRLYPHWDAKGWALSLNKQINFSNNLSNSQETLKWQRENKQFRDGKYWEAKSIDQFKMNDSSSIVGESLVKQYLDGEYVGSYMTKSYLVRI